MESGAPHQVPARERLAAHPEPPLTAIEAMLICGVLATALVSCWMLYGPLIGRMAQLLRDSF